MPYTSHYLTCAGREIHFTEWGAGSAGTVIAWHGLARTGRDMDELAEHLSQRGWRVICPDTLGRGLSQWSPDPKHEYCLAFYARLARELLDQLGIASTHWVGTSMGGAIGMVCASGYFEPSLKGRIRSLVLNDNAPQLAQPAIERIKAYAGSPPAFATVLELEAFFRAACPMAASRRITTRPWCASSPTTRTITGSGTTTTRWRFRCCACEVR